MNLRSMIDYQACLRAIVVGMKGISFPRGYKVLKEYKAPKGHKVMKRKSVRAAGRKRSDIVVVSSAQYKRLTGPDRPSEVPSALRELVLQSRSANVAR